MCPVYSLASGYYEKAESGSSVGGYHIWKSLWLHECRIMAQ